MDRDESVRIERAIDVLRAAMQASDAAPQQTPGVKLALRVLRRHCPDDWLLQFWNAAGAADQIGRGQGLTASYNGVMRQLRARGRIG